MCSYLYLTLESETNALRLVVETDIFYVLEML
jgi:hypothetical protein